jgi:hypothetical protein
MDIRLYTGFLVNYLYCTNRIDDDGRFAHQSTLMELLTNALEHGNCGISYEEKTEWLSKGGIILDLIDQKLRQPELVEAVIQKRPDQPSKLFAIHKSLHAAGDAPPIVIIPVPPAKRTREEGP